MSRRTPIWATALALAVCVPAVQAQDQRLTVVKGAHLRQSFDKDIERVAVSREDALQADPVTTREVLLFGRETGVATLTVWFSDGTVQPFTVEIRPDISLLQEALRDIDPSITAQIAPDRAAIVLRGTVDDIALKLAAKAAAQNYLLAGAGGQRAESAPIVTPEGVRVEKEPKPSVQVIDLIRLRTLPKTIEAKIESALRDVAGDDVRVRRVLRDDLPDDERDVLVLEGTVPDQIALTRCLHLASRLFLGEAADLEDIRVVANEAGGLEGNRVQNGNNQGLGGSGGGGGGQNTGINIPGLGGSSGQSARFLGNRVTSNIARASAIELAKGRILSFLEVEDLPQVRVLVRLYEVDRTGLFNWNPAQGAVLGDNEQGALLPTSTGVALQGDPATGGGATTIDGPNDIQNAINFIKDTGLSNQLQIAGSNFVYEGIFSALEADGIAKQLASPTLSVLSGELAQFQAGGEIPFNEAFTPAFGNASGLGTFSSVTFRQFGVSLGIRPLVGDGPDITLDVNTQVSQPDQVLNQFLSNATGSGLPTTGFSTRSLQTSSRLQDGQALLIGGLIQKSSTINESKTPIIGDIPLLGWMFRSRTEDDTSTELFILVSPAVVRDPIEDAQLWAMPDVGELLRRCVAKADDDDDDDDDEEMDHDENGEVPGS